jgi:hypothetical protein
MINKVIDNRQLVLREIADLPDEFIPFILKIVRAYKESIIKKSSRKKSPTKRLLSLAGVLENPGGLSVKQYKEIAVDEYFSQRL